MDGRTEIDFWLGKKEISKAEDVLENIEELFVKNGLKKSEIGKIAVSTEAGSATGLKIGMATARGLARGLESELSSVSLLPSLREFLTNASRETEKENENKTEKENENKTEKETENESVTFDESSAMVIVLPAGKNTVYYESISNRGVATKTGTIAEELIPDIMRGNPTAEIYAHQSIFERKAMPYSEMKNLGRNMATYIGLQIASDNEFDVRRILK